MRIVSFGDIHMALGAIERLRSELQQADLVLLSGDLTNFGGPQESAQVLAATRRYARQVFAVSGNLDRPAVIDFLRMEGISLHGGAYAVGDIGVFGCGGSNVTPFHTPTELSENQISQLLQRGYAAVTQAPKKIMVCHTPPLDTATDRIHTGKHVGSETVRRFIERQQPDLCITGHIHESAGVDRIGETIIINAGALCDGGYIVVDCEPDRLTAQLRHLT